MELRYELLPPVLDEAKVTLLAELADKLDGSIGPWEEMLSTFNEIAGTDFEFRDFQGIYGAENHADWVRRLLVNQILKPAENVTRAELIEIVRRAMSGSKEAEAYMAIFEANIAMPHASSLLFYPRQL